MATKTKKLTANGAMYRDGECSCCGEDGIARLTIVDRSDGTYCGETISLSAVIEPRRALSFLVSSIR